MITTTTPADSSPSPDPNEVRHPFGLPLGSVRAFMSLLICGFFWISLLWPDGAPAKPLLGHFFLLALVLMAFASSHQNDGENSQFLPWLLRFLFVGGTIGVIAFVLVQHEERLHERLTPDQQEFKDWWGTFLAVMSGGFATGLVVRVILGRTNHLFEALRAWLSVVGMVMLALEIALIIVFFKSENKQDDFLRYWQACELAIVSAYFGTRA